MKKEHGIIYKIYCKLVKAIAFLYKCMVQSGPFGYLYDDDEEIITRR